ncbi:hypothetical protein [Rubrobacter tropicus]|uniref:hypothetical protein n=1 Tax=Rubrobacter tropicus TaxID=2653851 RepID=UPI0014079DA3|nr:hypothetical protein [Rubrobacter tropicus]
MSPEGLADVRELGEKIGNAEGVARVESVYTVGRAPPATTPRGLPTPAKRPRRRPGGA